jgi:hypothetical protein
MDERYTGSYSMLGFAVCGVEPSGSGSVVESYATSREFTVSVPIEVIGFFSIDLILPVALQTRGRLNR